MGTRVSNERGPERELGVLADLDLRVVGKAARQIRRVFDELALRLPKDNQYVATLRGDTLTVSGIRSGIQLYALTGAAAVDSVEVSPDGVRLQLRGCSVGKVKLASSPVSMPAEAQLIDQIEGPAPFILEYAKLAESGDTSAQARARKRELLRRIAEEAREQEFNEPPRYGSTQPSIPPASGESRSAGGRGVG